jgi:hypothetical protein
MSSDRPPIRPILNKWKAENFVDKKSDIGTPFKVLPSSCKAECFGTLAKTLSQNGYTYEEMGKVDMTRQIADVCWREDKIVKMSSSEVNKAKHGVILDWLEVIDGMFCTVVMSKLEEHEKPKFKEEEKPVLLVKPSKEPSKTVQPLPTHREKPKFKEEEKPVLLVKPSKEPSKTVQPLPTHREKTKEELIKEIMEPKNRAKPAEKIDRGDDTNWEFLDKLGIEDSDE